MKLFKNVKQHMLLLVATIVHMLAIFCAVVLFSPIYILRFVLSKLTFLGPNLGEIITTQGTCFAVDDIYSKPKCTVVGFTVIKGDLPQIDILRQFGLNRIINVRDKDAKYKYAELQQHPFQWMGFLFWKWEDNFDISEHINDYCVPETNKNSKVSEYQIHEIENSLILKPFEKNRSPWEIFIVRNVQTDSEDGEPRTVVLCRFHHSLGDGFCFMKLIFAAFVDNGTTTLDEFLTKPYIVKKSIFNKMIYFCKMILLAPIQYTKCLLESYKNNEWISSKQDTQTEINVFRFFSEKNSLTTLKQIAKYHKVGLTAVIYTGLAAAMGKMIRKKTASVPEHIPFFAIVPMPGHPNKMRNHFAYVFLRLPVGETDPVKRLHKLQRNIDELKNSLIPAISFYTWPIIGALFPSMTKFFVSMTETPTISLSFPGPKRTIYSFGKKVDRGYFLTGPLSSNFAVNYHTITYCDDLRFTLTLNHPMFENQMEVAEMAKDIEEEFHVLQTGVMVEQIQKI